MIFLINNSISDYFYLLLRLQNLLTCFFDLVQLLQFFIGQLHNISIISMLNTGFTHSPLKHAHYQSIIRQSSFVVLSLVLRKIAIVYIILKLRCNIRTIRFQFFVWACFGAALYYPISSFIPCKPLLSILKQIVESSKSLGWSAPVGRVGILIKYLGWLMTLLEDISSHFLPNLKQKIFLTH